MIRAVIFDMDGVLVQSEKLKALSTGMAVQCLRGLADPAPEGIEAYRDKVGESREVVARHVVDKLDLGAELRPLMSEYASAEPWEVLGAMRRAIYEDMIADPQLVRDNQLPQTVRLVRSAKESEFLTCLATLSARADALHFVRALGLEKDLDLILGREDVTNVKPDPEIYLLAARRLGVEPSECVVIEDSPSGVRAGLAAGMNVVAFATPFSTVGIHASNLLDHAWVVHDPEDLAEAVNRRIAEQAHGARPVLR